MDKGIRSVVWVKDIEDGVMPGHLKILDQRQLPSTITYIETTDLETVWLAIRNLSVRGAPAIGIAAAMGVACSIQNLEGTSREIVAAVEENARYLATSRPTAVNLFWAVERMNQVAISNHGLPPAKLKRTLVDEAIAIREEDAAMCRAIGRFGADLLPDSCCILTHCNAGGLATAEFGTALAPVYTAAQQGKQVCVFADETRPLLQGARLTTWELVNAGIDTTLICDSAAAQVMKEERIDAVLVGADRIAANGDTANKIGTYSLGVIAAAHKIPFYVLAPTSTVDIKASSGNDIPIEQRDSKEITHSFGMQLAPEGVKTYAPAFDVTPARLITAIVTEKGVARPDFSDSLPRLLEV